jgi:flagellar biosynthetic protein FliR
VVVWPLYSVQSVPAITKVLLALLLALILFPIVGWQKLGAGWQSELLLGFIIKEVLTGLMLGYLTRLMFFTISSAGEMVSVSMGLSSAQLFNPALNHSSTSLEQFKTLLASLIFLSINGHHIFLQGLVTSFSALPIHDVPFRGLNLQQIATIGQGVLEAAIRLASPVVIAILMMNLALGIIGRAIPQINILSMGFGITIFAGFGALVISLPLFSAQVQHVLQQMSEYLFAAMKTV